ncbi:MAG: biopolymer transporter ExbD [Candidatus Cloacimonetes bacterium]|nr:biopolymer transporter ExbD [Candidatus Cloacimonadota bacterium]
MIRRKRKRIGAGISSASLGDMAFILLFFFISTTKFDVKKGLGIMLPGPSSPDTQRVRIKQENLTRVLINDDGRVAINNDLVSLRELEARVRAIVKENPEMVFILRADRQSKYVNMYETFDRMLVAGAERINLSTN